MKIDTDYVKKILDTFIESETNYIKTDIFKTMIEENVEKFLFHWDLLSDKSLIVNMKGEKVKLAVYSMSGEPTINLGISARLHDNGHEFRRTVQSDFRDYPINGS